MLLELTTFSKKNASCIRRKILMTRKCSNLANILVMFQSSGVFDYFIIFEVVWVYRQINMGWKSRGLRPLMLFSKFSIVGQWCCKNFPWILNALLGLLESFLILLKVPRLYLLPYLHPPPHLLDAIYSGGHKKRFPRK